MHLKLSEARLLIAISTLIWTTSLGRDFQCSFYSKKPFKHSVNNKISQLTFKTHQNLMFHGVVRERCYRFIVGLFNHCELFHRHLRRIFGVKPLMELLRCHCFYYAGEIPSEVPNEQSNRRNRSSMLPREQEKDWVEFEA